MTNPQTTQPTAPWRLSLQLPGSNWFQLPLGGDVDRARLETQVDARIEREPGLAESRQKLIDMLDYFTRDANKEGVIGAALLWALDDIDSAIVGTLYATVHTPLTSGSADDEIAAVRAELEKLPLDPGADVDSRDLPAGRALRVQALTNLPPVPGGPTPEASTGPTPGSAAEEGTTTGNQGQTEGRPAASAGTEESESTDESGESKVVLETVQYLVPLPAEGATVVLTFSTPNLAAAEHLVKGVDTIAEGLNVQAA